MTNDSTFHGNSSISDESEEKSAIYEDIEQNNGDMETMSIKQERLILNP